jgi:hypothetical protein
MALTQADKVRIAAHYAPILYFHPDEQFYPIRPEHYLWSAALWRSMPSDKKEDWGEPPPGWPRRPIIPRLGISVDPAEDVQGSADPDNDGVNEFYLGHVGPDGVPIFITSHETTDRWLDSSGWADSQEVTEHSQNARCNPAGAVQKWQETPGQFARTFSDWYYAEVLEATDLQRMLLQIGEVDGKAIGDIIRDMLGEVWIVWYYFLYPIHEEYLRRCEQVFEPDEKRGDYEGDWNAVAVVIKKPAVLPWDHGGSFESPLYVGYGVRLRGLGKDFAPSLFKQGMLIRPWSQTPRIGDHPRVFVARGYHNNYSEAGDHDPADSSLLGIPLPQIVCDLTEEVDEAANSVQETLDDIGETIKDIMITEAKIVAGAAGGFGLGGFVGSALGAMAGAALGIFEALSSSNTDDVPGEEVRKELEREPGPPDKRYGLVLTPDGVDPLFHDPDPAKNETATAVRTWNGTDSQRLVDRDRQIWWPRERGYKGKWGVRVVNDPNRRRSGIEFPDFQRALLNDLGLHLAKTTGP